MSYRMFDNGSDEDSGWSYSGCDNYTPSPNDLKKIDAFLHEKKFYYGFLESICDELGIKYPKGSRVIVPYKNNGITKCIFGDIFWDFSRIFYVKDITEKEYAKAVKGTKFESPYGEYLNFRDDEVKKTIIGSEVSGDERIVHIQEVTKKIIQFFGDYTPYYGVEDIKVRKYDRAIPLEINTISDFKKAWLDGFNTRDYLESLGYDVPDEETLKNNENNKKLIRKNELYNLVRDRKAVDYSKFDYNDICLIDDLKDEGKVFTFCKTVFFTEKADIEDVVKMLNFDSYSTTGSNSVKITGNGKGLTVNYTFCFPEKIKNKQINLLKNGKIFVSNERILETLNKTFKTDSYEINNLTQPWHFDQYVKAVYCVLRYEVGSDIKSALPFVERCSSDLMYGINNSIDYFVSKFKIREDLSYRSLKSKIVRTSIDYWIELFTPCTELCKLTGMRFRNIKSMFEALKAKFGGSDERPSSRPRFHRA